MLAEVQGALATSIWMVICPRLVFSTRSWVPEFAMPVVGGVPRFLRSGLGAAAGEALGSGLGAHTQENAAADAAGVAELFADGVDFLPSVLATISAMIPMTTTAVAAAPMMAPRLRRFWAAWARSAISRSRRARAAARWRSLSDDTVRNLPGGDLEGVWRSSVDDQELLAAEGDAAAEAEPDGCGALVAEGSVPTVSVWMVIPSFGFPSLVTAPLASTAPPAATLSTTSMPEV